MAAGLTLAVAEIVPTPPYRILASRNDSLPTKTSKLPSLSTSPPRRAPNAASPFECWILKLPWDLELGVWDFELVSYVSISPPRRSPNAPSPFGCWISDLPWDLELGVWDFELVSWRSRTNASR